MSLQSGDKFYSIWYGRGIDVGRKAFMLPYLWQGTLSLGENCEEMEALLDGKGYDKLHKSLFTIVPSRLE